jgi:hypothetical protein
MEYLTFHKFIAQDVLVLFYYFFALALPFLIWSVRRGVIQKVLFLQNIEESVLAYYSKLSLKEKVKIWVAFIALFFCAQLCLRMVFEAMIGYFNMQNYLYDIATSLKR